MLSQCCACAHQCKGQDASISAAAARPSQAVFLIGEGLPARNTGKVRGELRVGQPLDIWLFPAKLLHLLTAEFASNWVRSLADCKQETALHMLVRQAKLVLISEKVTNCSPRNKTDLCVQSSPTGV